MHSPLKIDEALFEYATPRQRELLEAVNQYGGARAASAALGVNKNRFHQSLKAVRKRAALQGYAPDHDMRRPVPDGFKVKGVSTFYDRDGAVRGQWVKSTADHERRAELLREAAEAMAEDLPRLDPIEPPAQTMAALANLYTVTDYHLGMYAWAAEGGADWSLDIAERTLLAAFGQMVASAPRARVGIVNIQGDFLHTDGPTPVTPTHGHILDASGRFSQMVRAAIRVIRRVVDLALMRHERVDLVIVAGNHDLSSAMWLRHMFSALYEAEPRLVVNDSEIPFYVVQHGEVMLGFHHGHTVKNDALPGLFAAQFPKVWGATTRRYAHCGHRHHAEEKEHAGMTVVQHPTLAARDAYATYGGWIADRAAQAITYHERFGQVGRVVVTPDMLETA
ncbi:hypothetical protein [Phenylobacterium conjunctum]|uniref:Oxidoreductase n=1 Tax=Phenylobacterium conjunctum TaxID=1298959 RepID=A0ABW3SY13_9CAUL